MRHKDNFYIYRIKTPKKYVYYAASDAIMALVMAMQDYKEASVEAVCEDDVDIIDFITYKAKGMV